MLDLIYERGEMFTLSLHNERVPICAGGLEAVLDRARSLTPAVWIAPMREVADWWTRRSRWRLEIRQVGVNAFELTYPAAEPHLTLIARGIEPRRAATRWYGDYHLLDAVTTRIESPRPPVLEVDRASSPKLFQFLQDEGFAVTRQAGAGGLVIPCWQEFTEEDKRTVLDYIEESDVPLVRIWRWPNGARSALSISGDIDSMTLIDFFRRPFEV
jgi:hypothetical protein